jgi:multiple sugar transport system permease protein
MFRTSLANPKNNAPGTKRPVHFWRETLRGYAFIFPVVLGLLIWTFGPMIASAYYSLTQYNLLKPPVFIGLENYINLFTNDDLFVQSVWVTLRYVLMFVLFSQVMSLALALLLTQDVRLLNLFRTLYYLPMVIPYIASALLWRYLFDKDIGPINAVLALVGIQGPSWLGSPQWALFSLVLISLWGSAVSTIIYVAGLQQVPTELYEAARIDGAGGLAQIFHITLPMLSPTILFNVVTTVIAAFQFFVPAYILTLGGPVHSTYVYNLNLYDKAFSWLQMGYASAMAWVLFAIIIVLTGFIFRSSTLWVYYEGEETK